MAILRTRFNERLGINSKIAVINIVLVVNAKLQSKIDTLNKKLNVKMEHAKQRAKQQQEKEAKAKVDALEKNLRK